MTQFIKALMFVAVAEMGDKTRLLAMANKCRAKQVLFGYLLLA
ncbi:TMEM165/GDT1 family protein [Clostridium gasigenes]|nr:TMEM165/GDT1 family protein [Clostridium gasigenes]